MAGRGVAPNNKDVEQEGKRLIFVDESNFQLLPLVVKTWGEEGVTPVIRNQLSRDKWCVIGSVSTDGDFRYRIYDHSLTSADAIRYLKILLNRYKGEDIVVLWDGAPIHRSNKIKQFLSNADVAKQLRLVCIPAYAPEFNPQEWIWSWLKQAMGNRCCKTLWELRLAFEQAVKKLRKQAELTTHIIQGCPIMKNF